MLVISLETLQSSRVYISVPSWYILMELTAVSRKSPSCLTNLLLNFHYFGFSLVRLRMVLESSGGIPMRKDIFSRFGFLNTLTAYFIWIFVEDLIV